MSRGRHTSVPLKQTATGEGYALRASARDLRKQFDTWRATFEAENRKLREQRDDLALALERLVNSPVAGSGDYILSERDLASARAAIIRVRDNA